MERPAYSITLEDLGAQVQWTVESDHKTVAEGVVKVDTWEGRSLPARLGRAFDRAYATSEGKREELLARDLEAAEQTAAQEDEDQQAAWPPPQISSYPRRRPWEAP